MGTADHDELRRRMAEIRENLHHDARGLAANAREMADWRYYVKNHPWMSLGVAAALGYLAIPRRLETTSPDAETLAKLAKQNRLVVQPQAEAQAQQSGLAGSLFSFAGSMLLRTGMTYAGQKIGKLIGRQSSGPNDNIPRERFADDAIVSGQPK